MQGVKAATRRQDGETALTPLARSAGLGHRGVIAPPYQAGEVSYLSSEYKRQTLRLTRDMSTTLENP